MNTWERNLLYATVFLTGGIVLILEVVAVRMLSPYFGASLYVVSSALTTVLTALSLGYFFGGRLADRYPNPLVLYTLLATASLILCILYFFSSLTLVLGSTYLPITYGPLLVSYFLFFFPAFILGIDSPFVIKLLATGQTTDSSGAVAGTTFFWSTLGSIVGSLAAGFVLIPFIGVKLTVLGAASFLSVFALLVFLYFQPRHRAKPHALSQKFIFFIGVLTLFMAALAMQTIGGLNREFGTLLYQREGLYSPIEVYESQDNETQTRRYLVRGMNFSSAIEVGSPKLVFQYTEFARAYRELVPDAQQFLLIGGGAYAVPRTLLLEDPDLHIDVVEIEPSLINIAQDYFELPVTGRLTNYVMDGRVFVHKNQKQYDVIFLDTFQSGLFIPPHLVTQEFFYELKDSLSEDGILIANIIGEIGGEERNLTGSILKTAQSVFPELHVYNASAAEIELQNLIVIARKNDEPAILSDTYFIGEGESKQISAAELLVSLDDYKLEEQVILTDDLAPTEILLAKQLIEYR